MSEQAPLISVGVGMFQHLSRQCVTVVRAELFSRSNIEDIALQHTDMEVGSKHVLLDHIIHSSHYPVTQR